MLLLQKERDIDPSFQSVLLRFSPAKLLLFSGEAAQQDGFVLEGHWAPSLVEINAYTDWDDIYESWTKSKSIEKGEMVYSYSGDGLNVTHC